MSHVVKKQIAEQMESTMNTGVIVLCSSFWFFRKMFVSGHQTLLFSPSQECIVCDEDLDAFARRIFARGRCG